MCRRNESIKLRRSEGRTSIEHCQKKSWMTTGRGRVDEVDGQYADADISLCREEIKVRSAAQTDK